MNTVVCGFQLACTMQGYCDVNTSEGRAGYNLGGLYMNSVMVFLDS